MRLVGITTVTAGTTGLSAAAGGAAAVAGTLLVPRHAVPAAAVAACLMLLLGMTVGALVGRRLSWHLRRVAVDVAVVTDGALDALHPLPAGADATSHTRPLPVREMQRLGDAFVALGARVRLADDLAERHRQEAEAASRGMVEMLSGLVAAEEGARGQLSAELHDTAAQSLAAARQLAAERSEQREAMRSLPRQPAPPGAQGAVGAPAAARVVGAGTADGEDAVADLVAEAEDALRATMARARPPALRDGDLAAAVVLLRDDLQVRYGLEVDLHWPPDPYPVPLAIAVTVYRFFQEALLNVVKHADVDDATASLEVDERYVVATVRDRGGGFSASTQPVAGAGGRHVGLGLLRERARLAGGGVQVQSTPGAGTSLTLRLPRPALPLD